MDKSSLISAGFIFLGFAQLIYCSRVLTDVCDNSPIIFSVLVLIGILNHLVLTGLEKKEGESDEK